MLRRNTTPILAIYLIYLVALAVTTALLVFWVAVVQRFNTEINQLISRLGVEWNHFHWFVQTTGYGLFLLVIVALTYLLAVTLSERRYSRKQAEFLSNVTHELKSPVAAIKLHAQTLEQTAGDAGDTGDDPEAALRERSVGYIVREAERVSALVDNLLEGSRLQAGGAAVALEPINLTDFFADYQNVVRGRFDLRQIELRFEVRSRAVVMATTDALQRIMDNLIDNALRFTHQGGEISCTVHDVGGDRAEIVVTDTGIGIPGGDLERIFGRFQRLGREIRGGRRGTGLGLAIVRGLVEELRGRIRAVPSENARGARFEIELPARDPASSEALAGENARPLSVAD